MSYQFLLGNHHPSIVYSYAIPVQFQIPIPIPAGYPAPPYDNRPSPVRATVNAHVDWMETPGAHVFTADVPGMKKEEIDVGIREGNILEISGGRSLDRGSKDETWRLVERGSGRFVRRFRLPGNIKVDSVGASMVDSVLTVIVPKEEANKPEVRSVKITD